MEKTTFTLKIAGFDMKTKHIVIIVTLHDEMQELKERNELSIYDQSSYYESSGDDDEMIHTTASKKEVRNTILFKFI